MQRQAIPLVKTQAPVVGTGMEAEIARGSGTCIMARRPGVVEYVSSEKIIIRVAEEAFSRIEDWIADGVDIYHLKKFKGSSHRTWIHQEPVVKTGDEVRAGDFFN